MKSLNFEKRVVMAAKKPKICRDAGLEKLDKTGYFLIRVRGRKIEVGLCNYDKINVIKRMWAGDKPQNIYRTMIKDLPKLSRDHCAYLGKELARAWICMKLGVDYIQDGSMNGEFPEVGWLKKK